MVNLICIRFAAQCISLIFALLLPAVSISLYFYSNDGENKIDLPKLDNDNDAEVKSNTNTDYDLNAMEKSFYQTQQNELQMPTLSIKHAITRIGGHITTSYSNTVVIQWSILWAISMCGFLQVTEYKNFTFRLLVSKLCVSHKALTNPMIIYCLMLHVKKGPVIHSTIVERDRSNGNEFI